jgi:hypothetical protein
MTRRINPELWSKPCVACGAIDRGVNGKCKPCGRRHYHDGSWPSQTSEYRKAYNRANPEVKRGQHRRVYGVSREQYEAMLSEQQGLCGICNRSLPLSIDHDHATGFVRGLLCSNCNIGIGNLQDDARLLLSAVHYLNQSNERRTALKVV